MAYQASRPSLFDNVGGTVAPRTQIDIEGAIDALTGGATSLIHATMLRKQAAHEQQQRADELAYQHERDTAQVARETDQQDWERKYKEGESRRADLIAGIVPAHTEQAPAPTMASVNMPTMPAAKQPSPVAKAMRGQPKGKAGAALPAPNMMSVAPPAAPKTAPLPASTLKTTTVPEQYDPERSQKMMGIKATDDARAAIADENRVAAAAKQKEAIAATAAVRSAANATNIKIAQIRAAAARGGAAGRTLTPNAISQVVALAAESMVAAHGGHTEELTDWIDSNEPEAVKLKESMKALPIAWETYLKNAKQKYMQRTEAPALRLQSGEGGMSPREAVGTVQKTRELINTAPSPKKAAAPAAAKVDSTKRVAPAAVPAAKTDTTAKMKEPDPTDDEIRAAVKALGPKATDADIEKHALAQRKKGKTPVK